MSKVPEWPAGRDRQILQSTEVHVWLAQLYLRRDELASLRSTLSPDELSRAANFRFDEHRERFVAAHGILRDILGRYIRANPQDIEFDYSSYGKPSLKNSSAETLIRFNLSHSGNLALIAVASGFEVGVDLEQIKPERATFEITERYFARGEAEALRALPLSQQCSAFFQCWARKEAYIKALGGGLQIPLDSFEVSIAPDQPAALLKGAAEKWSLRSLDLGAGYAGAVVAECQNYDMQCLRWIARVTERP